MTTWQCISASSPSLEGDVMLVECEDGITISSLSLPKPTLVAAHRRQCIPWCNRLVLIRKYRLPSGESFSGRREAAPVVRFAGDEAFCLSQASSRSPFSAFYTFCDVCIPADPAHMRRMPRSNGCGRSIYQDSFVPCEGMIYDPNAHLTASRVPHQLLKIGWHEPRMQNGFA